MVRSIHHLTRPLAPRRRSTIPAALPQAAGRGKIRARYARFFFAALCAAKGTTGREAPRLQEWKRDDEAACGWMLQQVQAQAELAAQAAELGDIELLAIP